MIKVLLAEDMYMLRCALVALLDLEDDIEVVADVAAGDEIMPMARRWLPDVAVIDIDLPVIDGLTVAAEIREELPPVKTLILTSLGRPGTVQKALSAKVSGFILKDASPSKLADAIRDVMAGNRVVDSQLALAAWDLGECPLTEREMDVLRLAAVGTSAKDIAARLYLSSGTVRNYLTSIGTKLDARNRLDAVRIATEAGWL
jgi:two-component system response regulator DesR